MYASAADLVKLIPERELLQLADDTTAGDAGLDDPIVAAVLAEAIDQAGREADAYLASRYPVPMDPVPPLVANLAAKMAVWNLHARRGAESKAWEGHYERCLKLLERIAEGKLRLGAEDAASQAAPEADGGLSVSAPEAVFGDSAWEKF